MAQEKSIPVFISGNDVGVVQRMAEQMRMEHRKGNPRYPIIPYVLYKKVGADVAAYRLHYVLDLTHGKGVPFHELYLCCTEILPEQWAEIIYADKKRIPIKTETGALRCQLECIRLSLRRRFYAQPLALAA